MARVGRWAFVTQLNSTDLADHIHNLLELPSAITEAWTASGAKVSVEGVWRSANGHGGPILPFGLVAELGRRGFDLNLDFRFDPDLTEGASPQVVVPEPETSVSLRFVGATLDPDWISKHLEFAPTFISRVGERHHPRAAPLRRAGWAWDTDGLVDSAELADHLREVISRMPKGIRSDLPISCRAEVHIVWRTYTGCGGPTIPAECLASIGARQLDLDFDVYFAG